MQSAKRRHCISTQSVLCIYGKSVAHIQDLVNGLEGEMYPRLQIVSGAVFTPAWRICPDQTPAHSVVAHVNCAHDFYAAPSRTVTDNFGKHQMQNFEECSGGLPAQMQRPHLQTCLPNPGQKIGRLLPEVLLPAWVGMQSSSGGILPSCGVCRRPSTHHAKEKALLPSTCSPTPIPARIA